MTGLMSLGNVVYMAAFKPKRVLSPISSPSPESMRLKKIWESKKDDSGFTQKQAAKAMGIGQTMVSHYINGVKPLGTDALLRFAKFLGVKPTDIRPNFEFADLMHGDLSPEHVEVARLWASLPPKLRNVWKQQLRDTVQTIGPRSTG